MMTGVEAWSLLAGRPAFKPSMAPDPPVFQDGFPFARYVDPR